MAESGFGASPDTGDTGDTVEWPAPDAYYGWARYYDLSLALMSLCAAAVNAFVLWVMLSTAKLRAQHSVVILASLCVADLGVNIASGLIHLLNGQAGHWAVGQWGCGFVGFTSLLFCPPSVYGLGLMAMERYERVLHRRDISPRVLAVSLTVIWLLSIVFAALPLTGVWGRMVQHSSRTVCAPPWSAHWADRLLTALLLCGMAVPMQMTVWSFHRIFAFVKATRHRYAPPSVRFTDAPPAVTVIVAPPPPPPGAETPSLPPVKASPVLVASPHSPLSPSSPMVGAAAPPTVLLTPDPYARAAAATVASTPGLSAFSSGASSLVSPPFGAGAGSPGRSAVLARTGPEPSPRALPPPAFGADADTHAHSFARTDPTAAGRSASVVAAVSTSTQEYAAALPRRLPLRRRCVRRRRHSPH